MDLPDDSVPTGVSDPDVTLGTAVRRADDDELLGFIRPTSDGSWAALAVFGGTIGVRDTAATARALIASDGLASLAQRWYHRSRTDGAWQVVVIQEAWPGRAVATVGWYALPGAAQLVITAADLVAGDVMTLDPPADLELEP